MTHQVPPGPSRTVPQTGLSNLQRWAAEVNIDQALLVALELNPDVAVFVVDGDQNIVHWSQGAQRLLGHSPQDVVGQHCLKANRCAQCIADCGLRKYGQIQGHRIVLFDANGVSGTFKKYARAFHDANGVFQGGLEMLVPNVVSAREEPEAKAPQLPPDASVFHGILTQDSAMHTLIEVVRSVAVSDVSVLVRGESGAGKELVARAIHAESHRKSGPFIAVNCAAFTPSLLQSTLFGHEKGAFTGAIRTHHGVFEQATGGTLFLDEVAELPLDLQASLLRVVQEQTFMRVGGLKPIVTDVRIVSATHRSLRQAVAKGNFREDLMFRLRVVPIFLPPLRDRPRDIPLLAAHFLREIGKRTPERKRYLTADANRVLLQHRWSGNARELRNALEYACAVGRTDAIELQDLPVELREEGAALLHSTTRHIGASTGEPLQGGRLGHPGAEERLRQALHDAGGHVGKAAALLGMSRPTFWRHRKKYNV